jgi:hypothetical protein
MHVQQPGCLRDVEDSLVSLYGQAQLAIASDCQKREPLRHSARCASLRRSLVFL